MAAKNRKVPAKDPNIKLGAIYDEIHRIMFNLEIRRKRLVQFSRSTEENGIHMKRQICNLIEQKQYVAAKREARNLVENNYEIMSMTVVVKKVAKVLELLRKKLSNPSTINSQLILFLKEVDKAIRGNDLREMDERLTNLKRYLQPDVIEEDIEDVKAFLEASKENEVNRIFYEICDKVNLVDSVCGSRATSRVEPSVHIPEFQTTRSLKKKKK